MMIFDDWDHFHDWLIIEAPNSESAMMAFDILRYIQTSWPKYLETMAQQLGATIKHDGGMIMSY